MMGRFSASLPFVGRIDALIGSGMSTFVASILSAVVVPLIGMNDHKDGTYTLVMGMFACGFSMGVADVSANAQAVPSANAANQQAVPAARAANQQAVPSARAANAQAAVSQSGPRAAAARAASSRAHIYII